MAHFPYSDSMWITTKSLETKCWASSRSNIIRCIQKGFDEIKSLVLIKLNLKDPNLMSRMSVVWRVIKFGKVAILLLWFLNLLSAYLLDSLHTSVSQSVFG